MSVWRVCQSLLAFAGLPASLWTSGLGLIAEAWGAEDCLQRYRIKTCQSESIDPTLSVVVTTADIAKGYVDLPASANVKVRSNTQDGYLLMFESQGEFMRQRVVKGLVNNVQISKAGDVVVHNTACKGMRQAQLDLGFRFVLAESARRGAYP